MSNNACLYINTEEKKGFDKFLKIFNEKRVVKLSRKEVVTMSLCYFAHHYKEVEQFYQKNIEYK